MMYSIRKLVAVSTLLVAASVVGCSESNNNSSDILVTDVTHTAVKRQSIGNCWLYAQATWLESLLLDHTGEEIDVSESYWTWWNWYEQIVGSNLSEVQTGGFWHTSSSIILKRGWVTEEEFIADEAGEEMSIRQAEALAKINAELRPGGKLARRAQRTAQNVRKQLDLAFGSDMAKTQKIAQTAEKTFVGDNLTLAQTLGGSKAWGYIRFPAVYGQNTVASDYVRAHRKALLKRVMRALNDKKPVVMSLMIDFNALDTEDQTFKKSLVDQYGIGTQGGHMVVLEDYTVENVPGYGYLGEGDLSREMKEAALQGDIVLLKAKNSWGANRPDRGLTDGYIRFDAAYLFSQLEWKYGEGSSTSHYTTLLDFVLPPGY